MIRTPTEIRNDIERLARERTVVLSELGRAVEVDTLAVRHAELDKRIGWLWEEFRVSRSQQLRRRAIYA